MALSTFIPRACCPTTAPCAATVVTLGRVTGAKACSLGVDVRNEVQVRVWMEGRVVVGRRERARRLVVNAVRAWVLVVRMQRVMLA